MWGTTSSTGTKLCKRKADKYFQVFKPLTSDVKVGVNIRDTFILNNLDSLRRMMDEDDLVYRNLVRVQCKDVFNVVSQQDAGNLPGFIEMFSLLLQSAISARKCAEDDPFGQVCETVNSACLEIDELADFLRTCIELEGFAINTPEISEAINCAASTLGFLNKFVMNEMKVLEESWGIDKTHAYVVNDYYFMTDTFQWDSSESFIWFTTINLFLGLLEVTKCNVVEYSFRLILASRNSDFIQSQELQRRQKYLEKIKANQVAFLTKWEKFESITGERNRIHEEQVSKVQLLFSANFRVAQESKSLQDCIKNLSDLIEKIQNDTLSEDNHCENLSDESFRQYDYDQYKTYCDKLGKITCDVKRQLDRYYSSYRSLHSERRLKNEIETSVEACSHSSGASNQDVEYVALETDLNNSDELFSNLHNDYHEKQQDSESDFDDRSDEFYETRGRFGDDDVESTTNDDLDHFQSSFGIVLDELKDKLIDRKETMIARERRAYRKIHGEDLPPSEPETDAKENLFSGSLFHLESSSSNETNHNAPDIFLNSSLKKDLFQAFQTMKARPEAVEFVHNNSDSSDNEADSD